MFVPKAISSSPCVISVLVADRVNSTGTFVTVTVYIDVFLFPARSEYVHDTINGLFSDSASIEKVIPSSIAHTGSSSRSSDLLVI